MILTLLVSMTKSHITKAQKNRVYVYIPAEYRDEFKITTDTKVNVEKIKGKLVITFPGDED
jgi:hypothetical protein